MDRSQYLARAIEAMQQGAPAESAQPSFSPQQMAEAVKARKAWESANPGQSYAKHRWGEMGDNLRGAPGRMAESFGNLASAPGDIAKALAQAVGVPGMPVKTPPFIPGPMS